LPNALNIPLYDIREAMKAMDKNVEYISVCQAGRRAAAAAFVMTQHGFLVVTLNYNPMFEL
jgi:rhodanese-related sulfurtransferase